MIGLTRDLCAFNTGVVADANDLLFARLNNELPFKLSHWRSGDSHNGWLVPDLINPDDVSVIMQRMLERGG